MLKKIQLTNFKSFREATVEFGSLTVLVGTNASGKSNLKDALRFLHGVGLGYHFSEILGGKSGPSSVLEWRGIRGGVGEIAYDDCGEFTIGCEIRFRHRTHIVPAVLRYAITVDVSDRRFGPRVVRESLSTQYAYLWDSHASDDPPTQKGQHQIRIRHRRGGSYRKHGKVSECSSFLPAVGQLAFDSETPASARRACTAVLEELKSIRFLDLDPDAMREPAQLGQSVLGDKGENLSSVLHGICADDQLKAALLSWVRALTPLDATEFEFETAFSDRVLVYLVESGGQRISAQSASDGTLRFLAVAAALLSPDTGRFYFFDELDNGIHPTRLHLLLQLAKQFCHQNNIQVVGSTHNPAMLTFLDSEDIEQALLIYRSESKRESGVYKVVDLPDIQRLLARKDLGQLHTSGWLENAVFFNEPDDDDDELRDQGGAEK
jgi:predicted ATPase